MQSRKTIHFGLTVIAALFMFLSAGAWGGQGYVRNDLLVEASELEALLKKPNVVLVDAVDAGTYQRAHIPGAVNIFYQLLADLKSRKENGYPATAADAEKIFGDAGIDNNTLVIVYDGGEGPFASAVWFALDFFGHDQAKVLNGGFRKWMKEKRPVTQETRSVEEQKAARKKFTAKPKPTKVVTLKDVKKNMRGKDALLVDTRSLNEFIGKDVVQGAARGGHIPGAKHMEWVKLADNMDTFKSADEIKKMLAKNGINKDTKVISYCQIGLGRSTFLAMAMKLVGYDNVLEYSGSWEEWSADPRLPIAK